VAHSLKVVFVFPGHGSQFVGMGKDVYKLFPDARAVFDQADVALGFPISKLCFDGPTEKLSWLPNVQPALLTFSLALLAVMRNNQFYAPPDYGAGHSLGEYTALAASGALCVHDAIVLAHRRGQFMLQAGTRKPCAAAVLIGLTEDVATAIADEAGVYIANYNSPKQVVISGELDRIKKALNIATTHGAHKIIHLAGSVAFHSPLMQSAADELAQVIASIHFNEPTFPIIGNSTASPIVSASALQNELIQQMCHPVQWNRSMSYLISQKADLFVEIGAGSVLSNLMKRIDKHARIISICDANTLSNFLQKGFEL